MILKSVNKPSEGDYKVKNRFAFIPTWIDNRLIWLQRYQLFFEYKVHWTHQPYPPYNDILALGWVLIDQKIIIRNQEHISHYE